MSKSIRSLAAPLALSLALVAGACSDRGDDLAQDSALGRDLELANQDSAAQPQLTDVPANTPTTPAPTTSAPRPSTSRPSTSRPSTRPTTPTSTTPRTTASGNTETRTPAGSEGRIASIAAGTTLTLASGDRICTNTHKPGDRFTATVQEAVTGSNGAVIPAGSKVVLQVSSVKHSENVGDKAVIGIAPQQVVMNGKSYPIDGSITSVQTESVRSTDKASDAKKVIGGAVAGAIIGQIIGKDTKSTVIGAATGAAAGTAVAMGTADYQGCIPVNGRIVVRLNSPATIQAE
ncbi:MAG TPA: hypothetical protein VJ812_02665 [Gemmatimonadaceae bacterium]|jgi:hypothetical protein|nr:hypothetical protein [Gemmatimonadaceae bacterium]